MTDNIIERELTIKKGIIHRLTGSILISYTDKEKCEKQVYDIGLNIKNMTKKVHIPDYVRYVEND